MRYLGEPKYPSFREPPKPPKPPQPSGGQIALVGPPVLQAGRVPIPAEAVALALTDAQAQPANVQPLLRYIWIPNGNKKSAQAISYIVNATISNMGVPYYWKPTQVSPQLVRINLGLLADDTNEDVTFQSLAVRWEEIPNPYFRIETKREIITQELQQFVVTRAGGAKILVGTQVLAAAAIDELFVVEGVQVFNGTEWVKITTDKGEVGYIKKADGELKVQTVQLGGVDLVAKKVRNFAEHTNLEFADPLQTLTQSNNPIVRYDAWLVNTFTAIDNGKYYEWINIPRASAEQKKKGISDLDALLLSLGARLEDIERLGSKQKVAMFKSGVTGKPRQVRIFKGLQGLASENEGRIYVTDDMRDNEKDPTKHAMRNLLEFQSAGHEVIWEWTNGTHRYALYDDKENLVASVPDDIAKDHMVPAPHTGRLESGISCLRCHGTQGNKGINPLRNDVLFMVQQYKKRYPGLDIFDDAADKTGIVPAVLKKLNRMYSGDLTKPIMRSRNDAELSCFKMTGGLTYQEMAEEVSSIYNKYVYESVTPQVAVKELGFEIGEDKAIDLLNWLLPPLPDTLGQGFSEEDPALGALKAGIPINRLEWEQAYVDAMNRTMLTVMKGGPAAQQKQHEAGQEALILDPKKEKDE
jgi:hypothetical protein